MADGATPCSATAMTPYLTLTLNRPRALEQLRRRAARGAHRRGAGGGRSPTHSLRADHRRGRRLPRQDLRPAMRPTSRLAPPEDIGDRRTLTSPLALAITDSGAGDRGVNGVAA